jgi:hypothetical protein
MEEETDSIVRLRLEPDARKEIKERTKWFAEILTAQAKINARRQNQNFVHKDHVDRAFLEFTKGWRRPTWYWDLIITAGGIVIGIGVPGFIQELQRTGGIRGVWVTTYTIMTILGIMALVFGVLAKRG